MQLNHECSENELILHCAGELDHHAARRVMDECERLATLFPVERCVLELSGLTFMDSSGLAVALGLYRMLSRGGRHMVVQGCPRQPMRVFEAAGLPGIIRFEEGTTCGR